MSNITNTDRSTTIANLTEILSILTKYENAYQELKSAESSYKEPEKVIPNEISEPEDIPLPSEPEELVDESKGPVLLFFLISISAALPGASHFPYGENILENKLFMIELIALIVCLICFVLSIISCVRGGKRVKKINAELRREFEEDCRYIEKENERMRNRYLFLCQQAIEIAEEKQKENDEQAKRDNAMAKLQADKARNSMDLMQKKYMQKFAHYLPERHANIASVKELLRIFTVNENVTSLQEAIDALERDSK